MKTVIFLAFALVINSIFWEEEMALNWLLFIILTIGLNHQRVRVLWGNLQGILSLSALGLSALFVVWQGTALSIAVALVSLIVFVGILHQSELRTSYAAFASAWLNFFKLPDVPLPSFARRSGEKLRYIWRKVRLIILPLGILLVFFLLFRGANVVFRDFTDGFFNALEDFMEYLFRHFSFARVLFFLFCLAIASWILYRAHYTWIRDNEVSRKVKLQRKRNNVLLNPMAVREGKPAQFRRIPTIALKNENRSALYTIISVSALLLIINILDIIYVWLGLGYHTQDVNYSTEVHEGVYFLIASILLSIAVMLYVFRGNQNFYVRGKRLVGWSTFWIVLNGVLVVSVFLRNAYYISYQGLTYKRIGVVVFLIVVVCGLISLLLKIRRGKSFFYMARFNSWSVFLTFVLLSAVNWDVQICRYNLRHVKPAQIDLYYLLSLTDEAVLELALSDRAVVDAAIANTWRMTPEGYYQSINRRIDASRNRFRSRPDGIWSWNVRRLRMEQLLDKCDERQEEISRYLSSFKPKAPLMTTEELFFRETGKQVAGAIEGRLFGKPCFKLNGKAFVCFFQGEMVFKLEGTAHTEALAMEGARLFDPSGKDKPMKEWVQLPYSYSALWPRFAQVAAEYIGGT